MTTWKRWFRHLFTDHWAVKRAFPSPVLRAIEKAIGEEERRHGGQLRFAVEASLPLGELLRGVQSRGRAVEWFGRLRVWDTEHNNGVLIYLLLADRDVEIVADRGIHAKTGTQWEEICRAMEAELKQGNYEKAVTDGIRAVARHLARHFPRGRVNELPDKPVVL